MKLKKIRLAKGFRRLFILMWAIWILILLADKHRELLTAVGSEYWLPENINTRMLKECVDRSKHSWREQAPLFNEEQLNPAEECKVYELSIPGDAMSKARAVQGTKDFLIFGILMPFIVAVSSTFIYLVGRWVFLGFTKEK